jgi:hypothetical protein
MNIAVSRIPFNGTFNHISHALGFHIAPFVETSPQVNENAEGTS